MVWVTINCNVVCLSEERDALGAFKNELYPFLRLSSWNGHNCCEWSGVECSRETYHVIKLHLSNYSQYSVDHHEDYLTSGILSPALFKLKHLEHLDLRANYLSGAIPAELFGLHRLKHLDVSFYYFEGQNLKHISSLHNLIYLNLSCAGADLDDSIQWHLGNLSQLQVIDLSSRNYFEDQFFYYHYYCGHVHSLSLEWTENVRGLKHLSLQGVELNMTGGNWKPHVLGSTISTTSTSKTVICPATSPMRYKTSAPSRISNLVGTTLLQGCPHVANMTALVSTLHSARALSPDGPVPSKDLEANHFSCVVSLVQGLI